MRAAAGCPKGRPSAGARSPAAAPTAVAVGDRSRARGAPANDRRGRGTRCRSGGHPGAVDSPSRVEGAERRQSNQRDACPDGLRQARESGWTAGHRPGDRRGRAAYGRRDAVLGHRGAARVLGGVRPRRGAVRHDLRASPWRFAACARRRDGPRDVAGERDRRPDRGRRTDRRHRLPDGDTARRVEAKGRNGAGGGRQPPGECLQLGQRLPGGDPFSCTSRAGDPAAR